MKTIYFFFYMMDKFLTISYIFQNYFISSSICIIESYFSDFFKINPNIIIVFKQKYIFVCMAKEHIVHLFTLCFTMYFLVKENFFSHDAEEKKAVEASTDPFVIRHRLNASIEHIFGRSIHVFEETLNHFFDGNLKGLKKAKAHALEAYDEVMKTRHQYYTMARQEEGVNQDVCHYYYRALTNMKEVSLSLETIVRMIHDHVANSHRIYKGQLQQDLNSLVSSLKSIEEVLTFYKNEGLMDVQRLDRRMHRTHEAIDQMQSNLISRIGEEKLSLRSTELYLSILQLVREMLNRYNIVFLMQKELNDQCNRALVENEQKTAEDDTFQSVTNNGLLSRLFKH